MLESGNIQSSSWKGVPKRGTRQEIFTPDPGGTPREAVPRSSVPEKNLQTGSELPSWPEYPATLLLPQCLIWKET